MVVRPKETNFNKKRVISRRESENVLEMQQLEIYSSNLLIMQFICYGKQRINRTAIPSQ